MVLDGAGQHPHGGEDAGRGREEHTGDAERAREVAGMRRPGAAEGEEREVARVEAALHGDRADGAHHVGVGHRAHARAPPPRPRGRAGGRAPARWRPAPPRRRAPAAPPARRGGRNPRTALASVTVGALPPMPVADRPGVGAGGLRADGQEARGVDGGDGARAVADLGHVHRRHAHHVAAGLDEARGHREPGAELVFVGAGERALVDQRRRGGGAAHVEGDEVRLADGAPEPLGADRARGAARRR